MCNFYVTNKFCFCIHFDSSSMGSASLFWDLGSNLINNDKHSNINTGMRRFRSSFGVSPLICEKSWNLLNGKRPRGSKPVHLLWTFLFLKQYNSEHVNHSIVKADEKTFRKWVWIFIYLLAELDVVNSVYYYSTYFSNYLCIHFL